MLERKSKFDYEVEAFKLAFKEMKESKIAIYGTGRMTATLLSRLKDFQIVGLLDRDIHMIGKEMYGVKIISQEEAEKMADLVVINTSETYWNTIYQRIFDWKIPVYLRNGELASKVFIFKNSEELYWKKNYTELWGQVQNYEVVSFDIFDTLVMRKVYSPIDIFYIIEKKFQKELGNDFSFVEARKGVEGLLENATIDEIYEKMKRLEKWDDRLAKKIREYEIEIENQMIIPRKDMVKLYNELRGIKEIFLVSDMYLPSTILQKILLQCGIAIERKNIIVSCDLKMSKRDGTLWKYYKSIILNGRRAIHIGDNKKADCELPKQYGIETYEVWSSDKLFQKSSIGDIVPDINTLYTSFYAGVLGRKIFNSPFALQKTNGKLFFTKEWNAGYYLLGNIVYVFCKWLLRQAKENGIKKLVFLAREGYLLSKLFSYYCQLVEEEDIPEIIYLETSRRAVMVASIQNRKDIYEIAQFPYIGNMSDYLQDRFGVLVEDKDLQTMNFEDLSQDKQKLQDVLKQYEKEILLEASRERYNYLSYLDSVGVSTDFAVIDSQLYGTIQFYLGKLLGKKIIGYYFCACQDKSNRYLKQNIMWGCFPGKKELDGTNSNIFKNALFIEAFFTAPNGMLEYIEDDGEKKYASKKKNQIHFDIRLEMMEGIQKFMEEAVKFCKAYDICVKEEDIYFTDKIFGIFMNNGFEPTCKMKNGFYYDNGLASHKEMPIWE